MAMQIQRGLVKYKDRSDIICTYGVSPAGIQYYFLDESKLSNGNIIVTTTLLEAVDPVAIASHVGVIDSDGNVVIQCVNKTIKPISSDVLLVEKAQPTSQNVLDALRLRNDPNSATRLVTTPATIKDNINKLMGSEGRFVFNDQFSEASIYDINGNNLVNDELYSFIGVDDKKIYFSKNTIESQVVEYSLNRGIDDEANKVPTLNVETTDITHDVIERALNDEQDEVVDSFENRNEVVPADTEVQTSENQTEESIASDNIQPEENYVYSEEANTQDSSTQENSDINYTPVEESMNEGIIPVEEPTEDNNDIYSEEVIIPGVEDTYTEDVPTDGYNSEENNTLEENVYTEDNIIPAVEEQIPIQINNEYTDEDNTNDVYEEYTSNEEVISDRLEETPEDESQEDEDDSQESGGNDLNNNDNYNGENLDNPIYEEGTYDYTQESNNDTFDNPVYVEDSYDYDYDYDSDDSYNNLIESYNYSNSSSLSQKNIFDDVTTTISNLVELNRNMQSMIDSYEIKLSKCEASRKKLVELSKSQAREISSLNARLARLEADKQLLESRVNSLTPSSNGELVRVMADAHSILGQTRSLRRNNY